MATQKQIEANRANAQLSSGPTSPEGKATSSHNAVKTGLTGQTVLLKTDDVAIYNKHILRFTTKFEPKTDDESTLVQDLADTEWRLLRITPLEAAVLANARIRLAPLFEHETDPAVRDQRLEGEVFTTSRKDLTNLSLQQSRLRKHRDLVLQELKTIQNERKARSASQIQRAASYYSQALTENWSMRLTDFGFDFTLDDLVEELSTRKAGAERDSYPEVTKKVYRQEYREEFLANFATD